MTTGTVPRDATAGAVTLAREATTLAGDVAAAVTGTSSNAFTVTGTSSEALVAFRVPRDAAAVAIADPGAEYIAATVSE